MGKLIGAIAICAILSDHAVAADATGGAKQLHEHMKKSASETQRMKMTGDVDHDFVAAMRKHHQDGIAMAKIALANGKDPKAREFAQKIVDDQTRELQQFDAWLAQHKPEPASRDSHEGHGAQGSSHGHP